MNEETPPRVFGWLRDLPDFRDQRFESEVPAFTLPVVHSLRPVSPTIVDQTSLGSCCANMGAESLWMAERQRTGNPLLPFPSRLFIYYNVRLEMHLIKKGDTGASIRDTIKAIKKYGAPDESDWPYDVVKFNRKAPKKLYTAAKEETPSITYQAVKQTLVDIKRALYEGHPVCFGFSVYASLMSPEVERTGVIPMPSFGERCLGGHAILAIGYDENKGAIELQNSWGPDWGDAGRAWLPYAYIENPNLASDFWVILTA